MSVDERFDPEAEIWVDEKAPRPKPCKYCHSSPWADHSACQARAQRRSERDVLAAKAMANTHKNHPDRLFETAASPADRSVAERWFMQRPALLKSVQQNKLIRGRCKKYGLTVGTWMAMVARQASKCAICEFELHPLKLCINHDHVTNEVRGLLCQSCNTGIGMLGIDGPNARKRASSITSYLRFTVTKS